MQQLTAIFNTLEQLKKEKNNFSFNNYPDFASNDYHLARNFLLAYQRNEDTFRTYRRELERYLQWLWVIKKQSLLTIKREAIEEYFSFCQNPPISWIGKRQVARYILKNGIEIPNPDWRPFVRELPKIKARGMVKTEFLSEAALKIIFAVLGSFYTFLMQEDKIFYNPVALIKQKNSYVKRKSNRVIRRLSTLQWKYVLQAANKLADHNPTFHNRTLFIIEALYGMYLRISELVAKPRWIPQMKDFYHDEEGNWWFKTVSKGNKERDISVSDAMLDALKRYRISLGLPELPSLFDNTPLIPNFHHTGAISDPRYIRRLVQKCFDSAYDLMIKEHPINLAEELKIATVHWLRHTGISDDVKFRPREHVRDDAGHSSSAITDKYIDVERRERHATAKRKTF